MLTHGNMTTYEYLKKQSIRYNNKPFLYFANEVITYKDMYLKVNRVASWLEDKGIRKGDVVTVMLKNCPTFYEMWFACGALGAVLLPVNTASTASELQYFLEHSESKGMIFHGDLVSNDHLEVMESRNLLFATELSTDWKESIESESEVEHTKKVEASDDAGIMYTSGTTAKPKGVMITHENYLYAGHSSVLYQQLTAKDRYLIFLPLFHVNSQYYSSMATLVVGGSIILLESFSASTFWDYVHKYKPTVTSVVATIVKILLRREPHQFEKDHTLRQAGYGLFIPYEEFKEFQERFGIKLFQWFGLTESITTNITTPLYEEAVVDEGTGILSIGKAGLGQEVKIIDENGKERPFGEVGEIIIKSPSLMKGYYKNEEASNDSLKDGWLYTGDNGYMNEEGYIWFVDRGHDLIKRAGENISSLEIENVLLEHPQIKDCAVIAGPDEIREEKVIAYIETDDQQLTEKQVMEFCKGNLAEFKIPEEVYFIDEFPRTSIGKIQKNILRDEYIKQ